MEIALYNGISSGMSMDGKKYFYVNPLDVNPRKVHQRYDMRHIQSSRVTWFGCACCPPNVARILTSLDRYYYDVLDDLQTIEIHLYLCGRIRTQNMGEWNITGNYLKDGKIQIEYWGEERNYTLKLRDPEWSKNTELRINGVTAEVKREQGYWILTRRWKKGDIVQIDFEVSARMIYANTKVEDNAGKVAIMRGPVVFCAEEADNGKHLSELKIESIDRQCENYVVLNGYRENMIDDKALYSIMPPQSEKVSIKMIPYSNWGNRGEGEMKVWMRKTL